MDELFVGLRLLRRWRGGKGAPALKVARPLSQARNDRRSIHVLPVRVGEEMRHQFQRDGHVTIQNLIDLRLVGKNDLVKILGRGKLEATLKVEAHKFTATAQAAIEAAGGEAVTI